MQGPVFDAGQVAECDFARRHSSIIPADVPRTRAQDLHRYRSHVASQLLSPILGHVASQSGRKPSDDAANALAVQGFQAARKRANTACGR
jgi:hypothetical protein